MAKNIFDSYKTKDSGRVKPASKEAREKVTKGGLHKPTRRQLPPTGTLPMKGKSSLKYDTKEKATPEAIRKEEQQMKDAKKAGLEFRGYNVR